VYKFEKKSDLFLYNQAGAKQGQSQNRIPDGVLHPQPPEGAKVNSKRKLSPQPVAKCMILKRSKNGLTGRRLAVGSPSPTCEGWVVPSRQGFASQAYGLPLTAFLSKRYKRPQEAF